MGEKLTSHDSGETKKKWDIEKFREFVARIANQRRALVEKQKILVNTTNLRKCQNRKGAQFRRIQKIASESNFSFFKEIFFILL